MNLDDTLMLIFIPVFFLACLVWVALLLRYNFLNPTLIGNSIANWTNKLSVKLEKRNDFSFMKTHKDKYVKKPKKGPSAAVVKNPTTKVEGKIKELKNDQNKSKPEASPIIASKDNLPPVQFDDLNYLLSLSENYVKQENKPKQSEQKRASILSTSKLVQFVKRLSLSSVIHKSNMTNKVNDAINNTNNPDLDLISEQIMFENFLYSIQTCTEYEVNTMADYGKLFSVEFKRSNTTTNQTYNFNVKRINETYV